MKADAQRALNFIVAKQCASEEKPVVIGNVEFWHEIPGFPVGLCYDKPVSQWDVRAVQDGLNALAEPIWDQLCAYLQTPQQGAAS